MTRAEDIADEFQTSIRTVYRDIAALAEAGVPIVGEAGVFSDRLSRSLEESARIFERINPGGANRR